MPSALETAAMRRFTRRMMPILAICYFIYRLDLLNVGFAALTMNKDLHLSATAYGFGVGVFYWGFFLCQVPSNIMLERVGAKRWLPFIMLIWAVIAGCMAFVHSARSFYIMRFILGAADSGFFPGCIFYLTYWVPAAYRGRMVGWFHTGGLAAPILGGPIAGYILSFNGIFGLSGWRWLFITESIPAVILSVVLFFMLTDRPAQAAWLTPEERGWLQGTLDEERRQRDQIRRYTMWQAMTNVRVLLLALVYLGILAGASGIGFWLPLILQSFGLRNVAVGFVASLPYIVAVAAMLVVSRHSDASGERIWHVALPILCTCAAFLVASYTIGNPILAVIAICAALGGTQSAITVFWALPPAFLSGAMAAAGVAFINAIGNLGGYFGPQIVGILKDATGNFGMALAIMAAWPLMAAIVILIVGRNADLRRALGAAR